ncbi:unnamed protein product, partial [Brenthis ino]
MFIILFIITTVASQEIPTPASLIAPRNFNYHPYQIQFLKENKEPTKQGPVLFPNDSPPPPKPPLVVTSRPLIESIARSELSENNSIAQQSQINNIAYQPYYNQNFGKNPENILDQTLFGNDVNNNVEYQATTYGGGPYTDRLKKVQLNGYVRENVYDDYEIRTALPPIYKALGDHANQNLLDLQKKRVNYDNQPKNFDYTNHYENNDVSVDDRNAGYDQDQNQNYAFSYTVKDHKTGDDFSHSQQSSGSATNGEYRVRLPDGRTQIVSYTADENGYKANVRYDDEKTDNSDQRDYYNINNYNNNNLNSYNNNPNNFNNNANNYISNPNNYNSNANNFNNQLINANYNANIKQTIPVREESDYNSKEYYDYSSEYNNNYQPYTTKFNFNPVSTTVLIPTVRPSYDDIKDLFTQRVTSTPVYTDLLVGSNNQDTKYDSTTEKVVLIGNKNLYTSLVSTPKTQSIVGPTPASYLASTIASLRDRIAAKPILSNSFINRINKYLSFK